MAGDNKAEAATAAVAAAREVTFTAQRRAAASARDLDFGSSPLHQPPLLLLIHTRTHTRIHRQTRPKLLTHHLHPFTTQKREAVLATRDLDFGSSPPHQPPLLLLIHTYLNPSSIPRNPYHLHFMEKPPSIITDTFTSLLFLLPPHLPKFLLNLFYWSSSHLNPTLSFGPERKDDQELPLLLCSEMKIPRHYHCHRHRHRH